MDSARLPMLPLRGHFDKRVYFGVLCTKGHRIHFQVPLAVPLRLPGVELQSRLLWTSWPPATCLLILWNHGSFFLCLCVGAAATATAAAAALMAAVAHPWCGGGVALHWRCLLMGGWVGGRGRIMGQVKTATGSQEVQGHWGRGLSFSAGRRQHDSRAMKSFWWGTFLRIYVKNSQLWFLRAFAIYGHSCSMVQLRSSWSSFSNLIPAWDV